MKKLHFLLIVMFIAISGFAQGDTRVTENSHLLVNIK
jgi:hypothetical protein